MASTRSSPGRGRSRSAGLLVALALAAAVAVTTCGLLWAPSPPGGEAPTGGGELADPGADDCPATGGDEGPVPDAPREGAQASGPARDAGASDLAREISDSVTDALHAPQDCDATAYTTARDVPEAASDLLERYRDEGDCLLRQAGYLDLLGNVWSCMTEGPGWVDVCVVVRSESGEGCAVRVVRLDRKEWEESYADAKGDG